jgi:hypothetical protein
MQPAEAAGQRGRQWLSVSELLGGLHGTLGVCVGGAQWRDRERGKGVGRGRRG